MVIFPPAAALTAIRGLMAEVAEVLKVICPEGVPV
jgi:hypothetical protein